MPWFEATDKPGRYARTYSPSKGSEQLDECQLHCIMMLDAAADAKGYAHNVYGERKVLQNGKVMYMLRAWKDHTDPKTFPAVWTKVYDF